MTVECIKVMLNTVMQKKSKFNNFNVPFVKYGGHVRYIVVLLSRPPCFSKGILYAKWTTKIELYY